jgi:hypothetical protein
VFLSWWKPAKRTSQILFVDGPTFGDGLAHNQFGQDRSRGDRRAARKRLKPCVGNPSLLNLQAQEERRRPAVEVGNACPSWRPWPVECRQSCPRVALPMTSSAKIPVFIARQRSALSALLATLRNAPGTLRKLELLACRDARRISAAGPNEGNGTVGQPFGRSVHLGQEPPNRRANARRGPLDTSMYRRCRGGVSSVASNSAEFSGHLQQPGPCHAGFGKAGGSPGGIRGGSAPGPRDGRAGQHIVSGGIVRSVRHRFTMGRLGKCRRFAGTADR